MGMARIIRMKITSREREYLEVVKYEDVKS